MAEDGNPYAVGDLVWVQVKGHPVWPGQVMNPDTAPKTARAQKRKDESILVAFFGDASFGWFDEDVVQPFKENLETYKKQRNAKQKVCVSVHAPSTDRWSRSVYSHPPVCHHPQTFKIALEEATELMTRREGGTPTTNHDPPDFLNPREGDFAPDVSDEEPPEDTRAAFVIKVAPPAVHEDSVLGAVDPVAALAWLLAGAQAPEMVDVDAVDGGMVLSLLKQRCVDPEGTAFGAPSKVCMGVLTMHGVDMSYIPTHIIPTHPHPQHHRPGQEEETSPRKIPQHHHKTSKTIHNHPHRSPQACPHPQGRLPRRCHPRRVAL